eukprot:3456905-Pyramimonas_sp.AAC.1
MQAAPEKTVGTRMHETLLRDWLTAFNAFWNTGSTFFGNGGAQSRIDYWIGTTDAMPIVNQSKLCWRSHQRLRTLSHMKDHIPMLIHLKLPLPHSTTPRNTTH